MVLTPTAFAIHMPISTVRSSDAGLPAGGVSLTIETSSSPAVRAGGEPGVELLRTRISGLTSYGGAGSYTGMPFGASSGDLPAVSRLKRLPTIFRPLRA